jgi:hypothetical protein
MSSGDLREHSLSWNDKVNAGANLPKCTSPANAHRCVMACSLVFPQSLHSLLIKCLKSIRSVVLSVSTKLSECKMSVSHKVESVFSSFSLLYDGEKLTIYNLIFLLILCRNIVGFIRQGFI